VSNFRTLILLTRVVCVVSVWCYQSDNLFLHHINVPLYVSIPFDPRDTIANLKSRVGLLAGYFDACNSYTDTARRRLGVDFGDSISRPRAAVGSVQMLPLVTFKRKNKRTESVKAPQVIQATKA
jgi:hypothetical protein